MATFVFENMTQAQANAITGADIIAFSTASASAGNVTVAIAASTDTIQTTTLTVGGKSLTFSAANLSAISDAGNLSFNDGSSLIIGVNTADTTLTANGTGGDTVYLFAGNDAYTASAGASSIYGDAGTDTITAGAGSSNLFGGSGADSLTGGAGNDHIYGQSAAGGSDGVDAIDAGAGSDYINGNAGADSIDGGADSDRIFGGADNDNIVGSGGNDTINGNLGNDSINGGTENDSIRGGQGNDSLTGGANDDTLLGDLGNDTITGDAGVDFVTGGAGTDRFDFTGAGNTGVGTSTKSYDTINDFVDGEDTFHIISGASTYGDTAGEVVLGASGATFTTVAAATTYAQQLIDGNAGLNDIAVVKVGSDTYLFYDSTGTLNAAIDTIIKLQGVSDTSLLTIADFV